MGSLVRDRENVPSAPGTGEDCFQILSLAEFSGPVQVCNQQYTVQFANCEVTNHKFDFSSDLLSPRHNLPDILLCSVLITSFIPELHLGSELAGQASSITDN